MIHKHKFLSVTALSVLWLTPMGAHAAEDVAGNNAQQQNNKSVANRLATLDEIIVTTQRRAEVATDVPLSITTQTGAQLERSGVTNTMELTKVVPGLTFTGTGAWAMPSLRGVSTTVSGPGNDSPVAIYVDGVYQPNQLGGFFDIPDIDRLEVAKGPQGTLFGRNATGGAIQIFTRKPSFEPTGSVTATAGFYPGSGSSNSAADLGVKGFYSGPISDTVAGSISFHYKNTEGYLNDIVRDKNFGDVEDYGARIKLLFQPSDKASFILSGFYNKRDDDLAASAVALDGISVVTQYPDSVIAQKPWEYAADTPPYVKTRTYGGSLRGDIDLGGGTLTTLTSYYNILVNARVDTDLGSSEACLQVFACIDFKLPNLGEKTFSQEVYYASEQMGRFSFVAGANYYYSKGFQPGVISDFSEEAPFPSVANAGPIFEFSVQVKTKAYAAYSELNYDLTDRLHLTGGARYSYETKDGIGGYLCCDPSELSPFADVSWKNFITRASLRYDVNDNANVYATFSQGFKSGVVPYSDFSAPTASPEKINAWEIGYKQGGTEFPFSIAAFYYDYKDLQVQFFDRIVSFVTNAASAKIMGFDFDGTWRPSPNFDFRLGASWLPTAKFKKYPGAIGYDFPMGPYGLTQYIVDMGGERLLKTPELTTTFTATYYHDMRSGRLTASGTLYYSSSYTYDPVNVIREDGYTTLNAEVSFEPNDSSVKYSLWARNITNSSYIASAIPGAPTPYVLYSQPRELGLSVNYSF